MPIVDVQKVLSAGLQAPDLQFLRPTEQPYIALLLQPSGPVFANAMRVGSLDTDEAGTKADAFDVRH